MRKNVEALLAFGVAAMLWGPAATAQTSGSTTVTASASIVEGIVLQSTADLNFGDIAPSAAAGTVTVAADGTATSTGGVTIVGNPTNPPQAAAYSILLVGRAGNKKVWFQVPANGVVTISNGASSMAVNNFTANLPCAQTGTTAPGPGPCFAEPSTLQVGATLSIGANQPVGLYSGTFNVTAHRF